MTLYIKRESLGANDGSNVRLTPRLSRFARGEHERHSKGDMKISRDTWWPVELVATQLRGIFAFGRWDAIDNRRNVNVTRSRMCPFPATFTSAARQAQRTSKRGSTVSFRDCQILFVAFESSQTFDQITHPSSNLHSNSNLQPLLTCWSHSITINPTTTSHLP